MGHSATKSQGIKHAEMRKSEGVKVSSYKELNCWITCRYILHHVCQLCKLFTDRMDESSTSMPSQMMTNESKIR